MAIPWLTILKNVPWSTVIDTAPTVADGAKKLWKTVATRSGSADAGTDTEAAPPPAPPAPAPTSAPLPADAATAEALQALEQRLEERHGARHAAVQTELAELRQELLASTELINALADQNAQLIARVEANRAQGVMLTRAAFALAFGLLLALAGLATVLMR